ncbi:hypothetical protein K9L67_01105 [Candidatus Woesearchaeota archaeon]|nr:hypothetical protein [Candidatus Woesearchaeota archaeon]MCF7900802.1 hypothetical protein [Candidatus Woesearchaeota archaeon]MCF8013104.1 hypothetical protein [Candidatus Woesearchaeota archaeon]
MKKILVLLIILLVLISATNFVLAQNVTDDEEDDLNEELDDDYCELDSDCEENELCSNNECEEISDEMNDDDENEEMYEEMSENELENEGSEEDNEESEEINAEKETFEEIIESESVVTGTKIGAKMRLVQLQAAITKNIIRTGVVTSYLSDKENDVSELEILITDLKEVLDQVNDLANNPPEEGAVEEFVSFKKESIDISKDFKDMAKELINSEDREELNKLLKDADYSALKDLKEKARENVREFNSERLKESLKNHPKAQEIANKIRTGELSVDQVKERVMEEVKKMKPEELKEITENMKIKMNNLNEKRIEAKEILKKSKTQMDQLRNKLKKQMDTRQMLNENKPVRDVRPGENIRRPNPEDLPPRMNQNVVGEEQNEEMGGN